MRERPLWGASFWVILTLILTIVMVLAALKPTLGTIAGLLGQIKQRKEVSAALDKKITKLREAEEIMENNRENIGLLDEGLPQSPEWNDLATRLRSIATESGINLSSFSYSIIPVTGKGLPTKGEKDLVLPGRVDYITFFMTGQGEYSQMSSLVDSLEGLRRILVVTTFQIDRNKDGALIMAIEGVAPYFPEGTKI
jgi:Tfp pilus assembly protein PilO